MKQRKDSQIAFRIDSTLAKKFRVACALRGDKLTTVFIRAIEEYIARTETEKTPNS